MIDWISPLPENISSYGPDLDFMFKLIYYVTGAFFVGLEGYLLFLVFRYGILSKGKGEYEPGTRNQILWILILGAVVLILDLLIDFKGAPAWAHVKEHMPATDLTVKVQAKQFDWTFIYPGKDGKLDTEDDISSYRDFHVPVHKKVQVILTSKDVLHSFFMPEVRFKQDVMPGRQIPGWFDTNRTGTFDLLCSELCGFGHTRMNGVLKVHEEKEFEAALAQLDEEQHGGGE